MADTYAVQPPAGRRSIARSSAELAKGAPIQWNQKVRYFLQLLLEGWHADKAAHQARISQKQQRAFLIHPEFRKRYDEGVEILRANERARNIHKAISVRDDEALTSPAGRKVQLDAAKWLHGEADDSKVNARVGVHVSLGYVIDLSGEKGKAALVIDGQAGPSSNVPTANVSRQAIDLESE